MTNKGGRPVGKHGWDYDGLHYLLWLDRMSGDEVRVNINRWAEIYGVSKEAIWQVFDRMVEQGRLSRTNSKGVYVVNRPE